MGDLAISGASHTPARQATVTDNPTPQTIVAASDGVELATSREWQPPSRTEIDGLLAGISQRTDALEAARWAQYKRDGVDPIGVMTTVSKTVKAMHPQLTVESSRQADFPSTVDMLVYWQSDRSKVLLHNFEVALKRRADGNLLGLTHITPQRVSDIIMGSLRGIDHLEYPFPQNLNDSCQT